MSYLDLAYIIAAENAIQRAKERETTARAELDVLRQYEDFETDAAVSKPEWLGY